METHRLSSETLHPGILYYTATPTIPLPQNTHPKYTSFREGLFRTCFGRGGGERGSTGRVAHDPMKVEHAKGFFKAGLLNPKPQTLNPQT